MKHNSVIRAHWPTLSMTIEFTVLELFCGHSGSLAKIQPSIAANAYGEARWLWIEDSSVTSLQLANSGTRNPVDKDYVSLMFNGAQGILSWPHGRVELLVNNTVHALGSECHGLIHQHLN